MLSRLVVALFLSAMAASAFALTVTDDTGEQVVLSGPVKRIVSLSPHITEMLFALGAGERIVGTVRFSDYPPAAKQIPRVGDAFSVNVEAVVELQPDVVLAWATGGAGRALSRLQSLGMPVYVTRARDLESIAGSLRGMGRLLGLEQKADSLADGFLEELKRIRQARNEDKAARVFFQISDRALFTVNESQFIGQAIELCGGSNIFGDLPIPVPRVSEEAVVAADPDLIIISQPAGSGPSPWIKKWQQYDSLAGKIRTIDPDLISRPSIRMLDGVRSLCKMIQAR